VQLRHTKWIYLGILALIWGSSFILMKKGLSGFTPLQLASLRIVLSAIFILLAGFYSLKTIKRQQWKWIIITGFIGTFFPAICFAYAVTEIDSAVASILNSLVPLNTILIGFAIFKIGSTKRQVLGVISGFLGTSILIGYGAQLNPHQNYLYAGFVILSTVMYAFNVNIIKRHLQDVKAIAIAAGNFSAILIPALILLYVSDFFKTETLKGPNFLMAFIYIVILAAFGTALAKVMFNKLIQISTAVFASSVTYLMTVVALGWGILDGEKFGIIQGFATLLILMGVYLANKQN